MTFDSSVKIINCSCDKFDFMVILYSHALRIYNIIAQSRFTYSSLIIKINNTSYLTQTSAYMCINLIKTSVLNITGTADIAFILDYSSKISLIFTIGVAATCIKTFL